MNKTMNMNENDLKIYKKNFMEYLRVNISKGNPIIGVAIGSGAAAKYAEEGGADFLLVLNAGIYRHAGLPSIASYLPFKSANEMVIDLCATQIVPRTKKIPIIAGICGTDPLLNYDYLFNRLSKIGVMGVVNYPTVSLIDGQYRINLEETGLGFEREVEFLREATKRGFLTIGYVHNPSEAKAVLEADIDILCINFGFTIGGVNGPKKSYSLQEAAEKAQEVFSIVTKLKPSIIKMVYGGPIVSFSDFQYILETTDADGFIGGSAIERIPFENTIIDLITKFKKVYTFKHAIDLSDNYPKYQYFDTIVGDSRPMQEIYTLIEKVAKTDVNVLITGESGTGKELIARAIHFNSKRKNGPFIAVNCAALPSTLLESELFGYEKGAFTGAFQRKIGRFELANGGTLFLDEISEMELSSQAKLLRAIQQKEFERLGGVETIRSDVRIIAASNKDLQKAVEEKKFREDLYYRLNVIEIRVPPLRERKEDIPILVSYFLKNINEKFDFNIERISPAALQVLLEYDWPGNVRELKNVLEHAAVLSNKRIIEERDLPIYLQKHIYKSESVIREGTNLEKLSSEFQNVGDRDFYLKILEKNRWNITKTAQELKISRKTLYKRLKNLKLM